MDITEIKIEQIKMIPIEEFEKGFNPISFDLVGEWDDGLYISAEGKIIFIVENNEIIKVYKDKK